MITALIFSAHIVFILIIFTKKWQTDSVGAGLQNIIFIIILFSVGWPLLTMFAKIVVGSEGLGINFDRDTMALTALAIVEYFFYKFYYGELFTEVDKEKQ